MKHIGRRTGRKYKFGNRTYLIRDLWDKETGRLITCQYATLTQSGAKKWTDCYEGVEFSAIEPYRIHRAW